MIKKNKYITVFSLTFCILSNLCITCFATPMGYVNKHKEKTQNIILSSNTEDNITGIKDKAHEDKLEMLINEVTPYLEDALQIMYDNLWEEVKAQIKEQRLDYEYTKESFFEQGTPYEEINYNELIAAYATVIDLGRNGRGLLKDAPLLSVKVIPSYIEDILYGEVEITGFSINNLFTFYGYNYDDEQIQKLYKKKLQCINDHLYNRDLRQNFFINMPTDISDVLNNIDPTIFENIQHTDKNTQNILNIATSLIGKIPYYWGGKASKAGYDTTWWSYLPSGKQKGLDCSGFIQWVYITAGYPKNITDRLLSTYSMREQLTSISREALKPGDIGLMKNNSIGINHCGIYLGNNYWIHCASSAKTVTVNQFNFKYFKRVERPENFTPIITDIYNKDANIEFSEDDIYTLAQLMEHEVGGEEYNAWIAVGEVVYNRIISDYFPDTLQEVVYQPRQFSYVSRIKYITPRPEMINLAQRILSGEIKLFNNTHVLFFRNTSITSGFPSTRQVDWGNFKWYQAVGQTAFYLGK